MTDDNNNKNNVTGDGGSAVPGAPTGDTQKGTSQPGTPAQNPPPLPSSGPRAGHEQQPNAAGGRFSAAICSAKVRRVTE